ncbi:MAG: EpiH/GdmH-related protein [Acidimicrobiales bacterium]|nr:EpiH/GdmH-related protein [Acidimicrobiales bacterium]
MIRRFFKLGVLLGLVIVGYFAVTFVQVWSASRRDDARPSQAIIVLGAAQYNGTPSPVLKARLDHAAQLYEAKIAPVVVLTGGRAPGDKFTEASASADYLRRAGIPDSALRLETDGRNSWQSLAAAARFLRKEGITKVVLVSSPYHSLRVEHIAGEVGLDGHASPATDAPDRVTTGHLIHETLAVGFGRILGYHRLVDLDTKVARVRSSALSR